MSKLKMFFLLLLLPLNLCSAAEYFNASGIDYCKMFCFNTFKRNSGCYCKKDKDRSELIKDKDMNKFRQIVVDAHNEFRNKLARGNVPGYPEAANMHMLRYDLELEHLARCYGLTRVKDLEPDECTTTTYCYRISTSQTIAMQKYSQNFDPLKYTKQRIEKFFSDEDVTFPKSVRMKLLKSYEPDVTKKVKWQIFARFIWATAVRIGCVLVKIDSQNLTFLICNYASRGTTCSAEEPGEPVYIFGKKCSLCDSKKCDKELGGKYDALCTEDFPAYDEPYDPESARDIHKKSNAGNVSKGNTQYASITLNVSVFALFLFVNLANLFK